MRTNVLRSFLALSLLAAGGCKWTDFDDLKEDTWVTATGKPDNSAANWGVAISRVNRGTGDVINGGTLAVLGANAAIYNDLTIGPGGDVNTTLENELNTNFAIGNLAVEPLLLARPDADEVALVTGFEANRVLVLRSNAGQITQIPVTGLSQPSGATYMVSPPPPTGGMPQMQILIAQGDSVFGAYFSQAATPTTPVRCALRDDAMPMGAMVNIRALAAYRPMGAMSDDVLALTENGKLLAYPGTVFHGCGAMTQTPIAGMVRDLGFTGAQIGSQIHVFTVGTETYALVQMHSDMGKGKLGLYKIGAASIDEIGTARDIERLRTAALLQPAGDPKRYVLVGLPTAVVEGVDAGQVQALELDLTTGIAATPTMTLFDAQPEAKQSFGRGVTVVPFNGRSIIAVSADNDVFLYFRTMLYGETREGR